MFYAIILRFDAEHIVHLKDVTFFVNFKILGKNKDLDYLKLPYQSQNTNLLINLTNVMPV